MIITQKVDKNDQLLGFFIEWLRLLSDKFERIKVFCLEKGEYDLPDNIEVNSLGKDEGYGKFKQFFNFYFLILKYHREYDAVLVHMNPIWVVLGGYFWKLFDKKIFLWYTHKSITLKLRVATIMADVIFTASPESFRLKSKKVVITGHGIDTELFRPLRLVQGEQDFTRLNPPRRFNLKILSVGRISPIKNYETLINAAKILKDKNIDFMITLIGEPAIESDREYEKSLKSQIQSLKLEENFNFIGKIVHNDLPKYYQSHDIFVHLSKTGSLDKTMLEAMACGIKVLSSNDAARTILTAEFLFNDDPQELADKIINAEAINSGSLRNYVVENHNLQKLITKISETIKQ